jgi:predicted PurR-regulated permease PerM
MKTRKQMSSDRQALCDAVFSLCVVLLAAYVAWDFLVPAMWAAILAIATWRMYLRLRRALGKHNILGSALATLIVTVVFLAPLMAALREISRLVPEAASYISNANAQGVPAPAILGRIPFAGAALQSWWANTLALPHGLAQVFSGLPVHRLSGAGDLLKTYGARAFHGVVHVGFTILCLFFFYLNGLVLRAQIAAMGARYLGADRWQRYARNVVLAIKSTVNGLVLVGLGEGVLIGIAYWLTGLPSPIVWAALTAGLAIIPFGAPVAYVAAAGFLAAAGNISGAIAIAVWGSVVLFVADHFIRPRLIGEATRMPFLLVLFGIFGGVQAFGLVGLFAGPAAMALFITLWREPYADAVSLDEAGHRRVERTGSP